MDSEFLSQHTACPGCDLLIRRPRIAEGQQARCPRCGSLLSRRVRQGSALSLSCSFAALLFLLLSVQFPFLTFRAQGLQQEMTLLQSSSQLIADGYPLLALLLALFTLVLPGVFLTMLILYQWLAATGHLLKCRILLLRAVYRVEPWCMGEVFMIGVLVSLIKISSMADVIPGLSFWAYILFTLSLAAAISGLDRLSEWDRLEVTV